MATLDSSVRINLLDGFTAPLRRIGQGLDGLSEKLEKTGGKWALAGHLSQAAEAMERFSGRMRNVIERPFNRFSEYQQELVSLKNVANLSDDVLSQLDKQIKDTSKNIGLATGQISSSYEALLAANFDVNDLAKVSREAINLGKGNRLDSGAATELMIGVMQSFGKGANDASHVGNVLAAADDVSTASASMLGDFLSRLGATARPMGIQMEDVASIGAILKDSGLKDLTEASTSVRNIITRLASPNESAMKALTGNHGLGFSRREVRELQGQVQGGDIFGAIDRITKQFDKFQVPELMRGNILKNIFGEGGEMGVFNTLARSVDTLKEKSKQFREDVEGTTERKAENADNSVAGRMAKMRAEWDVLMVDLGEKLTPVVLKLSGSFASVLDKAGKWVAKNPEFAKTLAELSVWAGGFAVVLGPVFTTLSSIVSLTSGLATAWPIIKGIGLALAGLSGPGLLAVGAIGGIAIFKDEFGAGIDFVAKKLLGLIKAIKDPFGLDDDKPKLPPGKLDTPTVRALAGKPGVASLDDLRTSMVLPGSKFPGLTAPVMVQPKTVDPASLGLTGLKSTSGLNVTLPGKPLEITDPSNRAVTKEQTEVLSRDMRAQQRTTEKLIDEVRAIRPRGRLLGGGSNFSGGF